MTSETGKKEEILILEDEKGLVLGHNYDGIQELDHPLPSWWIATFIGTAVFGILYAIYYLWAGGATLREEYDLAMNEITAAREVMAKQVDVFDMNAFTTWSDSNGIVKGQEVFNENCLACHEEKAKGDIGPNLTDEYWIHVDGSPEKVYMLVNKGFEDNGMPAWGEVIAKDDMYAVTAYILSLQGMKHPDGAKEPQGKHFPKRKIIRGMNGKKQ